MTQEWKERLEEACHEYTPPAPRSYVSTRDLTAALAHIEEQDKLLAECEEALQKIYDWRTTSEHSDYGAGYDNAVDEIGESISAPPLPSQTAGERGMSGEVINLNEHRPMDAMFSVMVYRRPDGVIYANIDWASEQFLNETGPDVSSRFMVAADMLDTAPEWLRKSAAETKENTSDGR